MCAVEGKRRVWKFHHLSYIGKKKQQHLRAAAVKQKKEKKKEARVLRVNAIDKPRSLRPSKPGTSALQKNLVKLIRW